jgi:hypothetical protein
MFLNSIKQVFSRKFILKAHIICIFSVKNNGKFETFLWYVIHKMSNHTGSLYVRNPNPIDCVNDREFRIFYYQYMGGHLYSSERRILNSSLPKKLIDSLLNMLTYRFSAVQLSDGSCDINITSSELFNRQHFDAVRRMLKRTIFQISLIEAQEIIKKLRLEGNVWKLEACDGYCLVVLSPHGLISRGMREEDFEKGQTWTRFKQEVDKLIAKKTAAAAVAASAVVPESGK